MRLTTFNSKLRQPLFHFGQCALSRLHDAIRIKMLKRNCGKKKKRGEILRCTERLRSGNVKKKMEKVFDERTQQQLSSCPSPHTAKTPPRGESHFKPLPRFIFPWLLKPDQSSWLPHISQHCSVVPSPPRVLYIGCSFRRKGGWWQANF